MKLAELKKPQIMGIAEQIFIYIPVLDDKDKSLNYIVTYPIGSIGKKIGLPQLNGGTVVHTAAGLGEISLADKKHTWLQAYAVCSKIKKGGFVANLARPKKHLNLGPCFLFRLKMIKLKEVQWRFLLKNDKIKKDY